MPDPSSLVLVITAPEDAPCLNATLTDTITRIIAKDAIIESRWLATGVAWELRVPGLYGRAHPFLVGRQGE